jgi:hypothetical protein
MPTTEELLNAYKVHDIDIPDEGYYPTAPADERGQG